MNFKLRQQYFIPQKWHNNILTDALNFVLQDKELIAAWEELFTHVYQDPDAKYQGGEIFKLFSKKICKRRCVTFLAVDGLNPSNEKQSSAIRQMLRQFEKKEQVKERAFSLVKSNDQCFKCGELGHWTVAMYKKHST